MTRAAPLPLDERRAALIAATEPLLERFGREVSTKQIAEAAGIAEGTIFRAFATKEALIDAVIEDAFGIQRTCDELAQVDLALSLEKRLVAAVVILQERLRRVLALFGSLRLRKEAHDYDSFRAKQQADNELLNSAIVPLIKPDQDQLRLAAIEAASAVRAITFSMTHHILGDQRLAEPQQIVDLVLHGICRSTSSHGAPTSC
ncbi:MAG TPA: TetR/AcrR family transcriptional regulator [Propionibacteriaceae bacterium]|nr:TetR/AcrR family transcriptional regulator [Propionibacteriaceae bacterium]